MSFRVFMHLIMFPFWIIFSLKRVPSIYRFLFCDHYGDVIMGTIASQITSLTIVYSTVYSDADQRKHQSSASLAFAWGIHRGPVNSPHKWPVTRKMFPFDDVIMFRIWLKRIYFSTAGYQLSQWGRVTHICVNIQTIIVSYTCNGLSPGRDRAIIWTNDGILLIGPLGTNFSEILTQLFRVEDFYGMFIEILVESVWQTKRMHCLKVIHSAP